MAPWESNRGKRLREQQNAAAASAKAKKVKTSTEPKTSGNIFDKFNQKKKQRELAAREESDSGPEVKKKEKKELAPIAPREESAKKQPTLLFWLGETGKRPFALKMFDFVFC